MAAIEDVGEKSELEDEKREKVSDLVDGEDEVEDDGIIHVPITTELQYLRYCQKDRVVQLCDHPGPHDAFIYLEAEDLDQMSPEPGGTHFHALARDAINQYNSKEKENLELKQILKLNYAGMFDFMTIEAWDKKTATNNIRTFRLALWDKECNGHPVVGLFKDINPFITSVNQASQLASVRAFWSFFG